MEVYIDKTNLKSMIASGSHPMFRDSMRMLKHKFDIKFNFDKSAISKEQDSDIRQWMTTMVDGAGSNNISYLACLFPERPLKSNMQISFSKEQLSALYLLDDEKVEQIKKMGCFLIASLGEEIDILSHLIIVGSDYSFDKKIRLQDMTSWCDFNDHISPCSDIIFIDQYILCDQGICQYNIYSLLKTLVRYVKAKINIVIITKRTLYDKKTKMSFEPNWEEIKKEIKNTVYTITAVKPNVTFVLPPTDIGEHDRTIFTNYRRIYSGDTFNYFDSSGNIISKGKEVHLCSMADKDNYEMGFSLLNDVQDIISNSLARNSDLILGDKKSNYLNFE